MTAPEAQAGPFAGDTGPGRTYRGYRAGDALAHVTADSVEEAVEMLLSHAPSLDRVVVVRGGDEEQVWAAPEQTDDAGPDPS